MRYLLEQCGPVLSRRYWKTLKRLKESRSALAHSNAVGASEALSRENEAWLAVMSDPKQNLAWLSHGRKRRMRAASVLLRKKQTKLFGQRPRKLPP